MAIPINTTMSLFVSQKKQHRNSQTQHPEYIRVIHSYSSFFMPKNTSIDLQTTEWLFFRVTHQQTLTQSTWGHQKKKTALLSMKYCLFFRIRDPEIWLYFPYFEKIIPTGSLGRFHFFIPWQKSPCLGSLGILSLRRVWPYITQLVHESWGPVCRSRPLKNCVPFGEFDDGIHGSIPLGGTMRVDFSLAHEHVLDVSLKNEYIYSY